MCPKLHLVPRARQLASHPSPRGWGPCLRPLGSRAELVLARFCLPGLGDSFVYPLHLVWYCRSAGQSVLL